jgi:DNA-binding NarL/FixJ family response regulator
MDRTRLVGRDGELALLREQFGRARRGEARIVFVRGEAGIGKTSVVQAALEASDPCALVQASGEESERDLGYGVVDQLLAGLGAAGGGRAGPTPVSVGAALLRAVSDRQASAELLVLWVDDLQWVDASSQQAIVFALRRLRADNVCAVLCTRDDESLVAASLVRLRSDPRAVQLDVGGLTTSHLAELARGAGVALTSAAVQRLHRHTVGNPLWSKALLRDLDSEHLQDLRRDLPAPRGFADVIAARVEGLSPDARALVEVAAVAGTDWPLGALAEVSGAADVYPALAEGVDAELLREAGSGPVRVRPVHALVAAAVASRLDIGRRAWIHAQLARTATSEHERLHHEIAASPGHDDRLAARVERVGREQLAEGSWATAASTLSTAARLSSDRTRRAMLSEEAMAMALLAGDVGQATALSRELAMLPDRPRALSLRGWLAVATGQVRDAEGLLRRSIQRAQDPDVESQARMTLAQLLIFLGRASEAAGEARRAIDLAEPGTPAAAHARGLFAVALATAGDAPAALVELGELDPSDGDPTHFPMLVARGSSLVMGAEYAQAALELEQVAARTDQYGMLQFSCVLHAQASRALYVLGDWVSAIDHGERAVAAAEDAELAWAFSPTHSTVAQTYARMGTWSLAERHARRAVAATGRLSDPMSLSYACTAKAVLARCRGDAAEAVAAVSPLLALTDRDGTDEPGILDWPVVLVEALLELGRGRDAEEALADFARHADRVGKSFLLAELARLRGELELARENPDQAVRHLREALELADAAGAPYETALAAMAEGRALRSLGRGTEATTSIRAAVEVFTRLGAQPSLDQATALLDGVGVPPAPRASVRGPGLTPQEIAVSRLVRKGLSNREIATELFLSTKTVEFHLRHVFMKLGVRSRTQLVARSAELLDLHAVEDRGDSRLGAVEDE